MSDDSACLLVAISVATNQWQANTIACAARAAYGFVLALPEAYNFIVAESDNHRDQMPSLILKVVRHAIHSSPIRACLDSQLLRLCGRVAGQRRNGRRQETEARK